MRSWLASWLLLSGLPSLAACNAAAPSSLIPDSGSLRCFIYREGYAAGASPSRFESPSPPPLSGLALA